MEGVTSSAAFFEFDIVENLFPVRCVPRDSQSISAVVIVEDEAVQHDFPSLHRYVDVFVRDVRISVQCRLYASRELRA